MYWGCPTSVDWGDIEEFLLDYVVTDTGLGVSVYLQAASGYGDSWWALTVDGRIQQVFLLKEGTPKTVSGAYDPNVSDHVSSVYPLGDWDNAVDIDVRLDQQDFESDKGKGLTVDWPAVMEVVSDAYGDGGSAGQFSTWSLTGISRFATSRPGLVKTEAKIDVTLTNSGGTRTVKLLLGNIVLASGSRVGDGVVTLTAQNNSGLSGSVTVTYTGNITSGCFVIGRWNASYTVTAGAITKTVNDDGRATTLSTRLSGLTPGNNTVTITGISDTGKTGAQFSQVVNVPGRPLPPGAIAYVSGNWANTVISVVASLTGSATYELYDVEALDGPCKLSEPSLLKPAQVGTFNWSLNSLPGAAAGKRRIVVKAVNGNVADGTNDSFTIEYDPSGNVLQARPNVPGFRFLPVTNGRQINVEWTYDAAGQAVAPGRIDLWVVAEGSPQIAIDGSGSDANSFSMPVAVNGIYRGVISFTVPADGWYNVCVKALTVRSSPNTALTTDPVWCSNVLPAAPSGVVITVTT